MKTYRLANLTALVLGVWCLGLSLPARAQATRTWVSGVGDDANPGSRTAPCKTFAGALSKTTTGGEMDVLDPGSFGAVTVTGSITIDGTGPVAAITGSGAPDVVVNAASTSIVTLRNLSISGGSTGTYGVQVQGAGVVRLENCTIYGAGTNGVDFEAANSGARLYLINCHIFNCAGAGVYVNPASGGTVVIEHCIVEQCGSGIAAAGGTVMLIDSSVTGNTGAGLAVSGTGAIKTFHNNLVAGNNPDGDATGSLPLR
jgi:hypothetical protein